MPAVNTEKEAESNSPITITIPVDGMMCSKMCQPKVDEILSKLNGVIVVNTSFSRGETDVTLESKDLESKFLKELHDLKHQKFKFGNKDFWTETKEKFGSKFNADGKKRPSENRAGWETLLNLIMGLIFLSASMFNFIPQPTTALGQIIGIGLGLTSALVIRMTSRSLFSSAYQSIKEGKPNSSAMICLGISMDWLYSMGIAMFPMMVQGTMAHYHFGAVNLILAGVKFGEYNQERSMAEFRKNMKALKRKQEKLKPATALRVIRCIELVEDIENELNVIRLRNGKFAKVLEVEEIPYKDLKKDDIFRVNQYGVIPTEGQVLSLNSRFTIHSSNMTGESRPNIVKYGHYLSSGTRNHGPIVHDTHITRPSRSNDHLYMIATCNAVDSDLEILDKVVRTDNSKSENISALGDKIAKWFFPITFTAALISFGGIYLYTHSIMFALNTALCVLVNACPCAIGLATPFSKDIAKWALRKRNIGLFNNAIIEPLAQTNVVIFDKTGTITSPELDMRRMIPARNISNDLLLEYAAAIEAQSRHPIAKAILNANEKVPTLIASEFSSKPFEGGVSAIIDDCKIRCGSKQYIESQGLTIDSRWDREAESLTKKGYTVSFVAVKKAIIGILPFRHRLKPEVKVALAQLEHLGITDFYICTGDSEESAQLIANEISIPMENVFWNKSLNQKVAVLDEVRKRHPGKVVLCVGDGANDCPLLKSAPIGASLRPTDKSNLGADLSLGGSITNIPASILVARTTKQNIFHNYKSMFLFNAAVLFYQSGLCYVLFGLSPSMLIASLTMPLSSIYVVWNSLQLSPKIESEIESELNIRNFQKYLPDRFKQGLAIMERRLRLNLDTSYSPGYCPFTDFRPSRSPSPHQLLTAFNNSQITEPSQKNVPDSPQKPPATPRVPYHLR